MRLSLIAAPVAFAVVLVAAGHVPWSSRLPRRTPIPSACVALDGDTLRCGTLRLRLNGIDAPELPGHCRVGRTCAPGDPYASLATMRTLILGQKLSYRRLKLDPYHRVVAEVYAGTTDLSCAMLTTGSAIYIAKWDQRLLLHRTCSIAH